MEAASGYQRFGAHRKNKGVFERERVTVAAGTGVHSARWSADTARTSWVGPFQRASRAVREEAVNLVSPAIQLVALHKRTYVVLRRLKALCCRFEQSAAATSHA